MNKVLSNGEYCRSIHVPGTTWAGANPFKEGFCFGSETSQIVFTDVTGRPESGMPQASAFKEAVNAVAFSQNWLAVTTRKDINFLGPFQEGSQPDMVSFYSGALGVVVAPKSGHFVTPLGPGGVMFTKPGIGEKDHVTISRPGKSGLNFCRAMALAGAHGNDLIVYAGRRGGLGYADYQEGIRGHMLNTVKFNNLDIVDICSLATAEKPLAVVAAAKDGALILFNDMLADKNPQTMKFKGVRGTVYRLLSARGDIYLLTSKGLFALCGLADKFLRGETGQDCSTNIHKLELEAADANMVDDKWLLAVGVDDVFRLDVEAMPKSPEDLIIAKNGELCEDPEQLSVLPQWAESSFEQESERMLASV